MNHDGRGAWARGGIFCTQLIVIRFETHRDLFLYGVFRDQKYGATRASPLVSCDVSHVPALTLREGIALPSPAPRGLFPASQEATLYLGARGDLEPSSQCAVCHVVETNVCS